MLTQLQQMLDQLLKEQAEEEKAQPELTLFDILKLTPRELQLRRMLDDLKKQDNPELE